MLLKDGIQNFNEGRNFNLIRYNFLYFDITSIEIMNFISIDQWILEPFFLISGECIFFHILKNLHRTFLYLIVIPWHKYPIRIKVTIPHIRMWNTIQLVQGGWHADLTDIAHFLDRNYCYKPVVIPISHYCGWALVLYIGKKSSLSRDWISAAP